MYKVHQSTQQAATSRSPSSQEQSGNNPDLGAVDAGCRRGGLLATQLGFIADDERRNASISVELHPEALKRVYHKVSAMSTLQDGSPVTPRPGAFSADVSAKATSACATQVW